LSLFAQPIARPKKRLLRSAGALALLAACGSPSSGTRETVPLPLAPKPSEVAPSEPLVVLDAPRLAPHAYGKKGDLRLRAADALYTFSTALDERGKKPLRGALLDVDADGADLEDPVLWFRPAFRDAEGKTHPLVAEPAAFRCVDSRGVHEGVRVAGTVDGVGLTATYCPDPATEGGVVSELEATGLTPGQHLADELGPGPTPVLLASEKALGAETWEGTQTFTSLALEGPKSTLVLDLRGKTGRASRSLVHIAKETFPSPVTLDYDGNRVVRHLRLDRTAALSALGKRAAASHGRVRSLKLGLGGQAGSATFLDAEGSVVDRLALPPEGLALELPENVASEVVLRDKKGVACARGPLDDPALSAAKCPKNARLGLTVHVEDHVAAPFHALVWGEAGTPDPELEDLVPQGEGTRSVVARNGVWSLDGHAELELRPGRYHVLVTRGLGYTLEERHLDLGPGASEDIAAELRRVIPKGVLGADFHLHSVPSPDSTVTLAARIATLTAEGIDYAVGTDHNRVTDLGAATKLVRPSERGFLPTFTVGDELTSGGARLWGHFNAYPLLPLPAGTAPEAWTVPYFDVLPKDLFAGARHAGARVLQVNHPRMPPKIGYFDQTAFDARSGESGPELAEDFDAVEAHNGIWLESPNKVREGLVDIVGLARRGKKVCATGNSDSHKMLFEEPGYPRTYVLAPPADPKAEGRDVESRVVSTVLARHTVVSSGAFVEATLDDTLPGSQVTLKPGKKASATLHVRVVAPKWVPVESVEVWLDDQVVKTFAVTGPAKDGVRFERTVTLPIDRDRTVAVWVDAKTPLPRVLHETDARAIAFTSPWYVDADGDGRVTLAKGAQASH
jgi:hypothetical protein